MADIAVIGCGGIGTRHVQAIVASDIDATVHVIDTNPDNLKKAKETLGATSQSIAFHRDADEMPEHLALAVIATSSRDRRRAFEGLLARSVLDAVVFEKVLFAKMSDYQEVDDQLASSNVKAWVNCPRRTWPGYQEARDVFSAHEPVIMRVTGSTWGLASNAVHWLDTFEFVTGRKLSGIGCDGVIPTAVKSKRDGYVEVFGRLDAWTSNGGEVQLVCFGEGALPRLAEFASPNSRLIVDEKLGRAFWHEDGAFREETFRFVNVSEMGPTYRNIVLEGSCELPTFSESKRQHELFLEALGGRLGIDVRAGHELPIT